METADKRSVSAAWNVNVFHAADTDEIFGSGRTDLKIIVSGMLSSNIPQPG